MASIRELHQQLIRKERSVEITQETLNRITQLEPKLPVCDGITALSQARAVDAKIAAGKKSVFWLGFL